jgi:hydrogenase expression/formation protein HypC
MCIELPGRVVEIDVDRPQLARVDIGGVIKTIHLGMLDGDPPVVGDWLALHLGFAIERLTQAEADEALAYAENDPFAAMSADEPATGAAPTRELEMSS